MTASSGRRLEIAAMEGFLFFRGLLYRGRRNECPVCGTRIRGFTGGGGSLRIRERGYCPRCNSKARHRRVWLHLERATDLFDRSSVRLLHVSPKYCLARRLGRMSNIEYTAVDLIPRPLVNVVGDLTALELPSEHFDAIVCVHVLEHIADDESAIAQMWRVLRSGGWALINVPMSLCDATYEDSSIVTPGDRRRAFGEADHVRLYGIDLPDRLRAVGFDVELFRADALPQAVIDLHGLTMDEHVLHCVKPLGGNA